MLAYFALQSILLAIGDNRGANLSAALKDSHDGGLVFRSSSSDAPLALTQVHIPRLAANERLVYFNLSAATAKLLSKEIILQSQSKPLQHEPCRLLSDAKSAMDFHATNAILAVTEHPESRHPFIHTERRILKDRSQFERELLLAGVAKPDAASLNERMFFRAATWTRYLAIRPTELLGVLKATIWIGEVNDGLLKGPRCVHA